MFFKSKNKSIDAAVRMLGTISIVLLGIVIYQNNILSDATKHIQIDIPPDLSHGATVRPGQKQHTAIYDFASRFFQQLHHWRYNGYEEYPKNIDAYMNYFTPSFKAFLDRDFKRRSETNELTRRTRTMFPLLTAWDDDRVKVLSKAGGLENSWIVILDMELVETYKGEEIKRLYLRYPVRVARADIDKKNNPWGLAIDGYADEPKVIKKEDL